MRAASAGLAAYLDSTTAERVWAHILTVTPRTGSVVRWTDHLFDIAVGGNTYSAGGEGTTHPKVVVGDREEVEGVEVGTLPLELKCGTVALFNGTKLTAFAAAKGFDGAKIKVERLYANPAGGWFDPMHLFEGPVGEVVPAGTVVEVEVKSGVALLGSVELPRHVYQPGCRNMLYDSKCALSKVTFTSSFTVKASPAPTVNGFSFDTGTAGTDPGRVAGYYRLGIVTFTSGALSGVQRAVRVYDWASNVGAITFDEPTSVAPSAGDGFDVYPGCDLRQATCENNDITVGPKFNNKARFNAEPYVPKNEAGI